MASLFLLLLTTVSDITARKETGTADYYVIGKNHATIDHHEKIDDCQRSLWRIDAAPHLQGGAPLQ